MEEVPVEYTSYVEADYEKRVPLDKYKKLKRMEDMILGLSGKRNFEHIFFFSNKFFYF